MTKLYYYHILILSLVSNLEKSLMSFLSRVKLSLDLPTPANLRPHEISRRLFEPIFGTYWCAKHARCLTYFKCLLKGVSELSNTTFPFYMETELIGIALDHKNFELINDWYSTELIRSIFEYKDDLGRTIIQQRLYQIPNHCRISIFSFHLCP